MEKTAGVVRVIVPADARFARLARLNAAGFAADLGFDVSAIEDVRVAVDELFSLVISGLGGGSVELSFGHTDGQLVVEGEVASDRDGQGAQPDDLVREILDVTTDAWTVELGRRVRRFRLVKGPSADQS